jgi:methionine sulfoxide reductase heme-binding subunit
VPILSVTKKVWLFRLSLFLPLIYFAWQILSQSIVAEPAKEANHFTGEWAIWLLFFNAILGVLLHFSMKIPKSLRFLYAQRRFLGLTSFFVLVLHVFFYFAFQGIEAQTWKDLLTKRYLIFGVAAWTLLFLLAATSFNRAIRWMGAKRWKSLHRVVHLAYLLIAMHVLSIEKTDLIKYGIMIGALSVLEGSRAVSFLHKHFWRRQKAA